MSYIVEAIGRVEGGRSEAEDDAWDAVAATIILDPKVVGDDAMAGLDAFSHVEIVYLFDRLPVSAIVTGARRPRGNPDWPLVGILAQRGRNRPNRIAVSVCRIVAVDGLRLSVTGLDAIDGTPVLDVKPVLRGFIARGEVREPAWAAEIMAGYW